MTDELIDFEQGGDNGQDTPESTQPIANTEIIYHETLKRQGENLRRRVEIIRAAIEDLKYLADYDRGYAFVSSAIFTLTQDGSVHTLSADGNLTILPLLAPSMTSGGRDLGAKLIYLGVPYLGTIPNELAIVASSAHTGQRGYADGQNLDGAALSVGANGITVRFNALAIAGGPGSITATVTGNPKRHILIQYGTNTPTTVLDLVTFINADANSQGTWGLRHLIRASTTSGAGTFNTSVGPIKLRGGYDAEAVTVTAAQLADFFLTPDNALRMGESLAIAFESGPVEVGGDGGRRQSLLDFPTDRVGGSVSNITPSVGSKLFNTGRNPELIPYSIPIGKVLGNDFFFLDGTRLSTGMPMGLGDSFSIYERLLHASSSGRGSGASMIGFEGSGNWHADSGAPPNLPSDTLNDTISSIVALLAAMTTNNSGARRIGGEVTAGTANSGSLAFSLAAGSLRQQLAELLNAASSSVNGGGINRRVSERGHQMVGSRPIYKRLGDGAGTGVEAVQGMHVRFDTTGQQDARTALAFMDYANQGLFTSLPFAFRDVAAPSKELLKDAAVEASFNGSSWVAFTNLTTADFARLMRCIPVVTSIAGTYGSGPASPLPGVMLELTGFVAGPSGDGPGLYYIADRALNEVRLLKSNGRDYADFTGATLSISTSKAAVLGGVRLGQGLGSEILHIAVPPSAYGGVHVHVADGVTDVAGTATYQRKPWMHVFMPNPASTALGTAYLGSIHYANSASWFESSILARHTTNIPAPADAALLKGWELGVILDATNNHHHGFNHTRTIMYATEFITVMNHGGAGNGLRFPLGSVAGGSDIAVRGAPVATVISSHLPVGVTLPSPLDAKLFKLASIVRCFVRVRTSTMTAGQRLAFCFGFYVGTMLAHRERMDFIVAANSPTVHTFSFQCTVPVYLADVGPYLKGEFFIRGGFSSASAELTDDDGVTLDMASVSGLVVIDTVGSPVPSFITIKEVGAVFGYKD